MTSRLWKTTVIDTILLDFELQHWKCTNLQREHILCRYVTKRSFWEWRLKKLDLSPWFLFTFSYAANFFLRVIERLNWKQSELLILIGNTIIFQLARNLAFEEDYLIIIFRWESYPFFISPSNPNKETVHFVWSDHCVD